MMNSEFRVSPSKGVVILIALTVTILVLLAIDSALADDGVRFCENPRTGEIVTVRKEYPCPAGFIDV